MCEKPYYHLTVKAFTDPNNPDVAEWAWVTFKKVHGTIVAPGDDRIEHLIGAGIPHLFLAFVRGWHGAPPTDTHWVLLELIPSGKRVLAIRCSLLVNLLNSSQIYSALNLPQAQSL